MAWTARGPAGFSAKSACNTEKEFILYSGKEVTDFSQSVLDHRAIGSD